MSDVTILVEEAREALGLKMAEASLIRPTAAEEAEARGVLGDVLQDWNRRRANSEQEPVSTEERQRLERWLFDLFFRLGPLQPYLDDESVEEITLNAPGRGFVVRPGGDKEAIDPGFSSNDEVRTFISRVVARSGRRIDDSSPSVDVRLPDGARLHAMLPPISRHVSITIRRHRLIAETLDDLIRLETVTEEAADFLVDAVRRGVNILVSGGTASGKTTTLNALGRAIPDKERVVTVEETRELRLEELLPDCVALEGRAANAEGAGQVSIRKLVRDALRMRPNRIVVGEVRGPEALDMISAMNSGHEGSMGTIHANDARQAVSKLRTYLLMAPEDVPAEVAAEMIAETIQLVVHLRMDGSEIRRVVQIAEVSGIDGKQVLTNDLFALADGRLTRVGVRARWERMVEGAEQVQGNGSRSWAGSRSH
jgi:pilus assembly protein CpaF